MFYSSATYKTFVPLPPYKCQVNEAKMLIFICSQIEDENKWTLGLDRSVGRAPVC